MTLELYIVTLLDADGFAEKTKVFATDTYAKAVSRACVIAKRGNHCGFHVGIADLDLHTRYFSYEGRAELKWTHPVDIETDVYAPKHLLKTSR